MLSWWTVTQAAETTFSVPTMTKYFWHQNLFILPFNPLLKFQHSCSMCPDNPPRHGRKDITPLFWNGRLPCNLNIERFSPSSSFQEFQKRNLTNWLTANRDNKKAEVHRFKIALCLWSGPIWVRAERCHATHQFCLVFAHITYEK